MCGVVDGGIVPGPVGLRGRAERRRRHLRLVRRARRAGRATTTPPAERGISVHELLTELAAAQAVGRARAGRAGLAQRQPLGAGRPRAVRACVVGQTLATRPEDIYRALLEATAFGTRTIIEAFTDAGVPVTELVVAGGLLKNALLMQIYADVTSLPLSTIGSEQGPGAGLGDPRRGRRGRLPRHPGRRGGHGLASDRGRLPADPGERRGLRRALRRVPRPCTTTSAAAPTT